MKGMIGALKQMQRRPRSQAFDDRLEQTQFRQRIARALQKQHRDFDIGRDAWRGRWKACRPDARESRETPARARRARVKAPAPARSYVRRTTGRPRSAAVRDSAARLPPPRHEPRHAQPPAHRAACCLFPCREIDSAASQCRARRDRPQPFPSTHGSCPRRPRARTRNTRGPAAAGSATRRPPHRARSQFGAIAPRLIFM